MSRYYITNNIDRLKKILDRKGIAYRVVYFQQIGQFPNWRSTLYKFFNEKDPATGNIICNPFACVVTNTNVQSALRRRRLLDFVLDFFITKLNPRHKPLRCEEVFLFQSRIGCYPSEINHFKFSPQAYITYRINTRDSNYAIQANNLYQSVYYSSIDLKLCNPVVVSNLFLTNSNTRKKGLRREINGPVRKLIYLFSDKKRLESFKKELMLVRLTSE